MPAAFGRPFIRALWCSAPNRQKVFSQGSRNKTQGEKQKERRHSLRVVAMKFLYLTPLLPSTHRNEPSLADMASQTEAVVKAHMQSKHGSNSLYLAIVKAMQAQNTSTTMYVCFSSMRAHYFAL